YPGYPQSDAPGWEFSGKVSEFPTARNALEVRVIRVDGTSKTLGNRSVIPPQALTLWSSNPTADATPGPAFHFLMATSGVARGDSGGIETLYRAYVTSTQRIGFAVPILYMRTTRGRTSDWTF